MRARSSGKGGFSGGLLLSIGAILLLGPGCDGGSSPTTPTPPPATCTYQLTAASQAMGPDASSTTVTVNTGANCSWTATVQGDWLSIVSGASGTGPGTVTVTVAANASEAAREATVRVADQSVRLTQQGRPSGSCDVALEPEWVEIDKQGGTRTANLVAGAGCAWTLVVTEPWLIVSPMSGTGSTTLSLQVPSYSGIPERRADIQVAGDSLRVDQAGDISACSYAVTPVEFTLHWHHTGGEIKLTAQAGCPWTVSARDWLRVPGDSRGDGDATILFQMGEFFDDGQRRAPVEVRWPTPTAGQNVWVTQEGCRYGLGPAPAVFPAAGGTADAFVVQQPVSSSCNIGCRWTVEANVPWIVLSKKTGADDDKFSYQVLPNTSGPHPRVGQIRVMTEVLTITQQ